MHTSRIERPPEVGSIGTGAEFDDLYKRRLTAFATADVSYGRAVAAGGRAFTARSSLFFQ